MKTAVFPKGRTAVILCGLGPLLKEAVSVGGTGNPFPTGDPVFDSIRYGAEKVMRFIS